MNEVIIAEASTDENKISEGPARELEEQKDGKQAGFSFIELMIIIVIMAGIAAIVGPTLFGRLDTAKTEQANIQMKNIAAALDLYHLDTSNFPTTDQGLEALASKPDVGKIPKNWRGPYLKGKGIPKDPWGGDYAYESDGSSFSLSSLGADGALGGEGVNADIPFKQ